MGNFSERKVWMMFMSPVRAKQVKKFIINRIDGIMAWYSTGAVVCPETIAEINKDLSTVFSDAQERFNLKKIKKVLKARIDKNNPGFLIIKAEDPFLN